MDNSTRLPAACNQNPWNYHAIVSLAIYELKHLDLFVVVRAAPREEHKYKCTHGKHTG